MKKVTKAMIHRVAVLKRNALRQNKGSKRLIYALFQVERTLTENLFDNGYEIDYRNNEKFHESLFKAAVDNANSFEHAVHSGSYFENDFERAKHYLDDRYFAIYSKAIDAGEEPKIDVYSEQAECLDSAFFCIYRGLQLRVDL